MSAFEQGDLLTGKFYGPDPTETEQESGEIVEAENQGPLKPGKNGHRVLQVYAREPRMTAYEASYRVSGDYHSKRRESTRLLERGFLVKNGVLPNEAPAGRPHVDAYSITFAGLQELERLNDSQP